MKSFAKISYTSCFPPSSLDDNDFENCAPEGKIEVLGGSIGKLFMINQHFEHPNFHSYV